ncbi:predicted oxidoreductase, aryl-alcohol dehydrogenase like protein [Chthonomonas calidirosea]|uniref:Predicted oxidoreductases (Related to aryl-alcohol dehydrogenases) n=1 Tax=Chthonomonas calidirosea (strain DSM 23976 / ICMP 18418 / T49) TaxID=1303518 RepID=S0EV53_CHTCT|nr:aldo/keto reductase [Chthonomonas calidirosea]CCW34227.1 Predicted oxidoreductases (related to aryl-alcohol dehydrogenases) [Chthonomonas calidirosea T49]CEK14218.1 predicted oxidoreductase, aryl-alcohol dehydrogenase like protein [Chthonomonas calidirosea]CEK14219.1 predicted oxidoreductase, aryl-alcohol dehydrogenase like protein [Chthonomonas calidirosea]CEK15390.1 predicted oxidoreductase, aryl-alcohol dehydrogenase like protein [Chthonomonas calidirosea]
MTTLEKRRLGNSDLEITPIGFGAWAIGGAGWEFGWGYQDDRDSIAAIHAALDAGINWIDTAAVYGMGHSEEIVAKAIRTSSHRPYVFTKCSLLWDEKGKVYHNLKSQSIRKEVEDSLRRLQTDVIDLYQIHWPIPDEDIEEGWSTLAQLKEEGKVRYIGVSNFNVSQMERIRPIAPITSLQPPYSLVRRDIEAEILPYCQQHNIGVIVYSPLQSGLLSGKMTPERVASLPDDDWRKRSPDFQEPRLSRILSFVERLRQIGARHHQPPGVVAIAWTLHHPAVTGAIVGFRRPDQVHEMLGALTFRLSEQEITEIEHLLRQYDL